MNRLMATPVLLAALVVCVVAVAGLSTRLAQDLHKASAAPGAVVRTPVPTSAARVRLTPTVGRQPSHALVTQTRPPAAVIKATVVVHNTPRTVVGGRSTPCAATGGHPALEPGCEIISSITAPGVLVTYRIVYPGEHGPVQTLVDRADARGHSLRAANVLYRAPTGSAHGAPATIAHLIITARWPDGTVTAPVTTRFTVIR